MLSKIGKTNSPPRHYRSTSSDPPGVQKLSLHTKNDGLQRLSLADSRTVSTDSVTRWVASPISAGLSPHCKHGWQEESMDYQSPPADSKARPTMPEADLLARLRETSRPATSGSRPSIEDSLSFRSRSGRGSYDQTGSSEKVGNETDFHIEETGVLRK